MRFSNLGVICDLSKSSFGEIVGVKVWSQGVYERLGEKLERLSKDHPFQGFCCKD